MFERSIRVHNGEIIRVNGKYYIVGYCALGNDIILTYVPEQYL